MSLGVAIPWGTFDQLLQLGHDNGSSIGYARLFLCVCFCVLRYLKLFSYKGDLLKLQNRPMNQSFKLARECEMSSYGMNCYYECSCCQYFNNIQEVPTNIMISIANIVHRTKQLLTVIMQFITMFLMISRSLAGDS